MSTLPGSASPARWLSPGTARAARALLLVVLVLFLQIPVLIISGIVSERRERRDGASAEISSKWGNDQTLTGPALLAPWQAHWTEVDSKGVRVERTEERRLVLLPESLHVQARMKTEVRRRGIYGIPVYRAEAVLAGRFEAPDFKRLGIEPERVDWKRAVISLGVSDARAIQEQSAFELDGRASPLEPGIGGADELGSGVHAELNLEAAPWSRPFRVPLALNGTRSLKFTPFGKQTVVEVSGAWPSPSFQGAWLPVERTVADSGFRAVWRIPYLGRNYPQAWTTAPDVEHTINASRFGLDLFSPIDAYRLCDRTVKYAMLFFVLTFTTFWLLEVLGGRPLHPIQYVLVGCALCLFVLLELSLSEQIGFGPAYLLASAIVVGLIVHYASAVLASRARAALVGVGLSLLYAFHYVVLRNEDYALLLGSLLLTGALAAVMSLTRGIRWDSNAAGPGAAPPAAGPGA